MAKPTWESNEALAIHRRRGDRCSVSVVDVGVSVATRASTGGTRSSHTVYCEHQISHGESAACVGTSLCRGGHRRHGSGSGRRHARRHRHHPPPSTDPDIASVRYARCMRGRRSPPDPDMHGDFSLTPADEKRMRAVDPKRRKAAERACFHHLEGLNLEPLSPHAIALATRVVADLGRCLNSYGHKVGPPQVRNLGRDEPRSASSSCRRETGTTGKDLAAGSRHGDCSEISSSARSASRWPPGQQDHCGDVGPRIPVIPSGLYRANMPKRT